jgi:hypothetical protein
MEILDEAVGLCIRCLGDRDGGVKPASRSKLLDNPLDQRLLSGLGQFNSLEAISQRLHSRANTLQNF